MKRSHYLIIITLVLIAGTIMGASLPHSGIITGDINATGVLLTASAANYFPSTSGINVSDYEYFGYEIMCNDAADDAIGVTVTLETSYDQTNWVAYTQNVFYSTTAAAAASVSIATDEAYYHGSIHPAPCPYVRLVLTEGSGEADVTAYVKEFLQ